MANERRLIDADKLQEAVQEAMKEYDGYSPYDRLALSGLIVADDLIDDAPTIEGAVIPVCCKDCEHYDGHICNFFSEWPDQYSSGHTVYMEPDDFCSYGERKNENQ